MSKNGAETQQDKMVKLVEIKEVRKIRARRVEARSAWLGLGALGMVGLSVVFPTLVGLVVGIWLDAQRSDGLPWTLIMLLLGLIVGCVNAWLWVSGEQKKIEREREERKIE